MTDGRRLTVDTPCDNDWNELEPRDGGRYCPQCDKVVVDLMKSTSEEAWARFDAAEGELCVRIRPDVDGDALFRRPPSPPASARLMAVAAGALMAACGSPEEASPEPTPLIEVEPEPTPEPAPEPAPVPEPTAVVEPDAVEPVEPVEAAPEEEHPAHPGVAHTALHHREYGRMGGARAHRPDHPAGNPLDGLEGL